MTNWLTTQEVAERTKLSPRTLAHWRLARHAEYVGPPYVKLRSAVRYPADLLEVWMRAKGFIS
jgi:hypothetical protein